VRRRIGLTQAEVDPVHAVAQATFTTTNAGDVEGESMEYTLTLDYDLSSRR